MIGAEALDSDSAGRRVAELRRAFGIEDGCLIGESYSDLAMAAAGSA